MDIDKYLEMGNEAYWKYEEEQELELIKKLRAEGATDEDLFKNENLSRSSLKIAGVKPSYLIPTRDPQYLGEDWDYHIPNEGKWEFIDGIPFLDGGFSRDTLAIALITNIGLERLIEILPFDSIYDLKQLIEDRIYRKSEGEGLICDMREKATIDYNSAMGTAERKGIEEVETIRNTDKGPM